MVLSELVKTFYKALQNNKFSQAEDILKKIYSNMRGKQYEKKSINYIPGIHFSYVSPEASNELYDYIFDAILSNIKFLDEKYDLCSKTICQIASYDFKHFVDEKFSSLLITNENDTNINTKKKILALVSRTILDPIKGFLSNAPLSPRNIIHQEQSESDIAHFDFFGEDSPDLETEFGQALIKYRKYIYEYFIQLTQKIINKYVGTSINETFFVPSFASRIQTVIVPQAYRTHDIDCGFPARMEAVLAFSNFQDLNIFSKLTPDYFNRTTSIAKQYSDLNSRISGFPSTLSEDYVKFSKPYNFSDDLDIQICKLLLFLNPNEATCVPPQFINLILFLDAKYSAFFLCLAQEFYWAYPGFSFSIFDDIFAQMSNLSKYTPEQSHSFFHMLKRLVDVLACLPQRYIEDQMIEQLNAFALLGMASYFPRIRYAAFKLLETLGHFEAGDEKVPLVQILKENSVTFEQYLLQQIEKDPMIQMTSDVVEPIMPLPIHDALVSVDFNIWQYLYSAIGIFATQNFSEALLNSYKKIAIEYVSMSDDQKAQNSNNGENIASWQCINILTFLSALAETPLSNFGEENTNSLMQSNTDQILNKLYEAIHQYINTSYPIIRTLLTPLNISSFSAFLNKISQSAENPESQSVSPQIVALVLRSMAWNNDFNAISQHEEFFSTFLDIYIKNFSSFNWGNLFTEIVEEITDDHIRLVNDNWIFVNENLMTGFKIFSTLYEQKKKLVLAPFPICEMLDDDENPYIHKIQVMGKCLVNLSRIKTVRQRMQTYAIATLTKWSSCCHFDKINFLATNTFYEIMPQFPRSNAIQLLISTLAHHFELVFSQYLQWSLKPGYSMFFSAICKFFRAPSMSQNTLLSNILKAQWLSCININQTSPFLKHLQIIYENVGTLILCCLFYMNMPELKLTEESFVLLASLIPVLDLFHMSGRPDNINRLMTMFLDDAKMLEHSTGYLNSQTILAISKTLSETFAYCMEAVIYSAFEILPLNSQEVVERTLRILMPWFQSIEFDLENRVISNQTELLFLHFSCYSFIDKLLTSYDNISKFDMNSSFYEIWKHLILKPDNTLGPNFVPVELAIIYACSYASNHQTALPIIRYLYRIAPIEIVSILCSYLSLNKFFYDQIQTARESVNHLTHVAGNESGIESKIKHELFLFIYKALDKLAQDSFRPIHEYIPSIFASCVIYIGNCFIEIKELLLTILEALKQFVPKDSIHILLEAIQTISSLTVVHCQNIDNAEITKCLTNLLYSYNQQMAADFGHELLKWALCCGDVKRATIAIRAYSGNTSEISLLVIGLLSRSMWTVSDAIPILHKIQTTTVPNSFSSSNLNMHFNSNSALNLNFSGNSSTSSFVLSTTTTTSSSTSSSSSSYSYINHYAKYLATALNSLIKMVPNKCTQIDLIALWLALSSLDWNNHLTSIVFNAALNLLLVFLTPQNFATLTGNEDKFIQTSNNNNNNDNNNFFNDNSFKQDIDQENAGSNGSVGKFNAYSISCSNSLYLINAHSSMSDMNTKDLLYNNNPVFVSFSPSTFWRYHKPWGNVYHGALFPILDFSGPADVDLMILVLNRLIQTQYMKILSDSPCGIYVALLALLPWMWHVATTEISRFLFDSVDVQNMELTVNALETLIENKEIFENLAAIYMSEKVDIFFIFESISDLVVPLVDDEGVEHIGRFYATCVNNSKKSLHVPIYSIASKILKLSSDKEKIAKHFSALTNYVKEDSKKARAIYIDMYLNELPKSALNDDFYYEDEIVFKEIPMYERIVAMNIPHLYDVNANEAKFANFDDLNSFPPLLPNNWKLLTNERFSNIYNTFKKFKTEPFSVYSDIMNKIHTSLVDVDALNVMKLCEKINYFPVNRVFSDTLRGIEEKEIKIKGKEEEEVGEELYQDDYSLYISDAKDPYEMVTVLPTSFMPTMEEMNMIGQDYFDEMEA